MDVRIFLVDNHPLFRDGMRLALQRDSALDVVGEASSGEEAIQELRKLESGVDVVLLDLQISDTPGIEAIKTVVSGCAVGAPTPRVLVVSMVTDDDRVVAALRAGAHGFLVKDASREELVRAIHIVADGGAVFSAVVASRLARYFSAVHELPFRAAFPELTDREREVLDLLARGHNNRRIARELVLAEKTVRNHVTHLFAKLQVTDRTMAAMRARDAGLGT